MRGRRKPRYATSTEMVRHRTHRRRTRIPLLSIMSSIIRTAHTIREQVAVRVQRVTAHRIDTVTDHQIGARAVRPDHWGLLELDEEATCSEQYSRSDQGGFLTLTMQQLAFCSSLLNDAIWTVFTRHWTLEFGYLLDWQCPRFASYLRLEAFLRFCHLQWCHDGSRKGKTAV